MLVDEYDVSARDTRWYVSSMHHWDDADPGATVVPRDGSAIQRIQNSGKSTSERACRALFDGEVDALGVTESQLPLLLANSDVKRLFENSREVEENYFRKTKILPIMHVMALKRLGRETSGVAWRTLSRLLGVKAMGAAVAPYNSKPG